MTNGPEKKYEDFVGINYDIVLIVILRIMFMGFRQLLIFNLVKSSRIDALTYQNRISLLQYSNYCFRMYDVSSYWDKPALSKNIHVWIG